MELEGGGLRSGLVETWFQDKKVPEPEMQSIQAVDSLSDRRKLDFKEDATKAQTGEFA